MQFGFSYVGLIYLIMLALPNIIWTKHQPKGYQEYESKENKALQLLERVGQFAVSGLVLMFKDFNVKTWSGWSWWLILSFSLMLIYEVYWIRYFRSAKTMMDFYRSLLGIPVPGATLPVVALFLLGVYGKNPYLMLAVIILGIGHMGIHLTHWREIRDEKSR